MMAPAVSHRMRWAAKHPAGWKAFAAGSPPSMGKCSSAAPRKDQRRCERSCRMPHLRRSKIRECCLQAQPLTTAISACYKAYPPGRTPPPRPGGYFTPANDTRPNTTFSCPIRHEEIPVNALEYMRYRGKDTPRRCFSP